VTPPRTVRWATFAELDTTTLYRLLRLRVDVFVVEQHCPYPDLDGRDLEAGTVHGWIEDDAGPVAYVRLLYEPGATRIGRVTTTPARRGEGLAATLVEAALARSVGPVVLDAQSHLREWYERYGFVATGPEYLDDGIPHVPMRLDR
jgi:ElaA protein